MQDTTHTDLKAVHGKRTARNTLLAALDEVHIHITVIVLQCDAIIESLSWAMLSHSRTRSNHAIRQLSVRRSILLYLLGCLNQALISCTPSEELQFL
jgi:hypothetical protein